VVEGLEGGSTSSPDQRTSQQGTGAGHTRLIVIGAVIAAIAIGVVLLAVYGSGGSSTGY
jgi:hypothetical protein